MANSREYEDIYLKAVDGTGLHARDYAAAKDQETALPILCMHGLTRNCRDFEPMIARLNLEPEARYIVPDQRGRGLSDYADAQSYSVSTYAQDMWQLLEHLKIDEFMIIGTSMGGLISMAMYAEKPQRIKGICLNDIGPSIDAEGLTPIMEYLGKNMHAADWQQAIENTQSTQLANFPDFSEQDWLGFVKQVYRQQPDSSLVLDYDPAIAIPFEAALQELVTVDLWPLYLATESIPILIVRGALSTLLSEETGQRMVAEHAHAKCVEIANRGHCPLLDEPAAIDAITDWIKTCNQQA